MNTKKLGLWMAAALASVSINGCADDGVDEVPDSGPGDGSGGGEVRDVDVTIATVTPAALLAVRNSDEAAWRQVAVNGQSEVVVPVHGAYEVTVVCASEDPERTASSYRVARTVADDRRIEQPCGGSTLIVRGKVQQPGGVTIGKHSVGQDATNWPFVMAVSPGTFDMVLKRGGPGAVDAVAIHRGVSITGNVDLGTINLAAETMIPLVDVHPVIEGRVPEENGRLGSALITSTAVAGFSAGSVDPTVARLLPTAALAAGDQQSVSFAAETPPQGAQKQVRRRSASASAKAGEVPTITLPDPMGPTTFSISKNQTSAGWQSLPKHDEVELLRIDLQNRRQHQVVMSANFIKETKATSANLDFTSVPGYLAQWQIDPAREQGAELYVRKGTGIGATVTSVEQLFTVK